jgi:hypothetical protein
MRLPRLIPLAAAAVLVAPALTGCGAEKAAGVDVAKAASVTAAKQTAAYSMRLEFDGLGLGRVRLPLTGVTSLTEPRMTMRGDIAPFLSSIGIPLRDGRVDLRVDGKDLYLKPPRVPGFAVPGGKTWVALDVKRAATAMGLDAEGLAPLLAFDPSAYLRLIARTKDLKRVGSEMVRGTSTTHYRGRFALADIAEGLPASKRTRARRALKELEDVAGSGATAPSPMDLWVDEKGVLLRMTSVQKLPAGGGVPAGSFSLTYDLTRFGVPLDVSRPSSVADVTGSLEKLLKGGLLGEPSRIG